MSLYPVSYYNIGTGLSSGTFDSLSVSEIDDANGNPVFYLSSGVATAVNAILGNLIGNVTGNVTGNLTGNVIAGTISLSGTFTDGNSSVGTSGQYLTSTGTKTQWVTLTIGNGTLTISNGTHISGSTTFTANQSGNSSITIATDATNLNTFGTIVARDSAGNFSATTITANLTGNVIAGTISLSGTFTDGNSSVGTSGQYLTSTGTKTQWVTLTIGNGTLTISNGTHISGSTTFTANQSGNSSITIATDATNLNTFETIVARDSVGNFSATTITANLTGASTQIGTTNVTSGTFIIPLVPLSTTSNQAVSVRAGFTYNATTNTLTATTFDGGANYLNTNTMTGSIYYPVCVNTSGNVSNQIAWTNSTFNFTQSTNTLNIVNAIASGTITTPNITADYLYLNDAVRLLPLILHQNNDFTTWTIGTTLQMTLISSYSGLPYGVYSYHTLCVGGGNLSGVNGNYPSALGLTDTLTNNWAITTSFSALTFFNDNFQSAGGYGYGYVFKITNIGRFYFYTNNYCGIPLDTPMIMCDGLPIIYSTGVPNALTSYVTITYAPSVATNAYDIQVAVNGNNPNGRTITLSVNLVFQFIINAVSPAVFPTTFNYFMALNSPYTATLNGSPFTGFTLTPTGLGTFNFKQTAISNWTIYQPCGQVSITFTPTNTGNDTDIYNFSVYVLATPPTLTGVTITPNTGNGSAIININQATTTATFTRNTGSGTLTTSSTPTNSPLSVTKSNGNTTTLTLANVTIPLATTATGVATTAQSTSAQLYYPCCVPLNTTSTSQSVYTNPALTLQYTSATTGNMILRGDYRVVDKSGGGSLFWDIYTTTGNALTFDYASGVKILTISTAGLFSGCSTSVNTITATQTALYPTFALSGTGVANAIEYVDTDIVYNSVSNTLTCPNFAGAVSGNITGDITGNVTGNVTGFISSTGVVPTTFIQLDTPSIDTDNITTASYSSTTNSYGGLSTYSGTSSISYYQYSIPIEGNNPNGRIVTCSSPMSCNFVMSASTPLPYTSTINLTAMTASMTKNGTAFTNFTATIPTLTITKTYTASTSTSFSVQQPFCQLSFSFIPDDTGTNDTYICSLYYTATASTTAGGAPVFQPVRGGATQNWMQWGGSATNLVNGGATAVGFTFNSSPATASAFNLYKSLATTSNTLGATYITGEYLNLVYSSTFTSAVTSVEDLAFGNNSFTNFTINWLFTTAPTSYTSLYVDLANYIGVVAGANWVGNTAILGSAYSAVAWSTTSCFVCYMNTGINNFYSMTITNPKQAKRKTITCTNNGSQSALISNVPFISCGTFSSATAYPSFLWGVVGTAVSGSVKVYGFN